MACDSCGPPAPAPEPDVTPIAALNETSSCKNSCCDGENTAPGQEEPAQEESDDFYSPGKYTDEKIENIDAPDCCRGKPVVEPPARECAGSCCGISKNAITKELSITDSSGSCCKPPKQCILKGPRTGCAGSCCTENQPASPQGSCTGACCSSAAPDPGSEIDNALVQDITDIEKQDTGKEYVVLSISGMTCTGCETKLNRTLGTVPAVKDLKNSLVLSRAEFNIDLRLGSVEEVD
ncbi:copper-transporting ATPase [Penicillium argentinense]|uniref:Copper-transporting ATPase n=1 Tax=Penicillium argentinense TaxID=1131581 RepID=A0A9W9KBH1_9EURO|nr:copper-transporting ATPase [Penicillium argentinense]KAJ5100154.1 copper-transporting ATPase [Penicillium argentinense]